MDTAGTIIGPAGAGPAEKWRNGDLETPVYRRHLDNGHGSRKIVEQWFLYRDASGSCRRGRIDQKGEFTSKPVTFVKSLPDALDRAFFKGPSALAPNGHVSGRIWRWREENRNTTFFEFEFTIGERRGIGRVADPGPEASACFLDQP